MQVATADSSELATASAVHSAHAALVRALGGAPHWLLVQSSVHHDRHDLQRALAGLDVPAVHASSSCLGSMTERGAVTDRPGLAMFGVRDPGGGFGVGAAPLGDDPHAAAGLALQRAIDAAGRPGEMPALVWLTSAPGHEEACIAGLEALLGRDVPIVGGSAADDAVAGGARLESGEATAELTLAHAVATSAAGLCAFLAVLCLRETACALLGAARFQKVSAALLMLFVRRIEPVRLKPRAGPVRQARTAA